MKLLCICRLHATVAAQDVELAELATRTQEIREQTLQHEAEIANLKKRREERQRQQDEE